MVALANLPAEMVIRCRFEIVIPAHAGIQGPRHGDHCAAAGRENKRHAYIMVQKLISGGQTGADQCILAISRRLGIPIDGLVPKGWLTEAGPQPLLGQLGFRESDSADYRVRTRRNVEQGDATLIFATDPDSDGTGLTIEHASQLRKPWLLVDPFDDGAVQKVRAWLVVTQPAVLNVAGNRESKSPGIAQQAERVLYAVLSAQRDQ